MDTVVFTVHNRPDCLDETLASWRKVRGLDRWMACFVVEPTDRKDEMMDVIWRAALMNCDVRVNPEHYGVLRNPYEGLKEEFAFGTGFVVLAEEDLVVSTDVLEYMEHCRDEFEDDEQVLAVCAESPDTEFQPDGGAPEIIKKVRGFNPHVWGTWRDRWYEHLEATWDLDYGSGDPGGWDWNINKRLMPRLDKVAIFPAESRACHIGRDGVHMRPEHFEESVAKTYVQDRPKQRYWLVDGVSEPEVARHTG